MEGFVDAEICNSTAEIGHARLAKLYPRARTERTGFS
jgi:hypothetical protein